MEVSAWGPLVECCMRADPAQRPTMTEVVAYLADNAALLGGVAHAPSPLPGAGGPPGFGYASGGPWWGPGSAAAPHPRPDVWGPPGFSGAWGGLRGGMASLGAPATGAATCTPVKGGAPVANHNHPSPTAADARHSVRGLDAAQMLWGGPWGGPITWGSTQGAPDTQPAEPALHASGVPMAAGWARDGGGTSEQPTGPQPVGELGADRDLAVAQFDAAWAAALALRAAGGPHVAGEPCALVTAIDAAAEPEQESGGADAATAAALANAALAQCAAPDRIAAAHARAVAGTAPDGALAALEAEYHACLALEAACAATYAAGQVSSPAAADVAASPAIGGPSAAATCAGGQVPSPAAANEAASLAIGGPSAAAAGQSGSPGGTETLTRISALGPARAHSMTPAAGVTPAALPGRPQGGRPGGGNPAGFAALGSPRARHKRHKRQQASLGPFPPALQALGGLSRRVAAPATAAAAARAAAATALPKSSQPGRAREGVVLDMCVRAGGPHLACPPQ